MLEENAREINQHLEVIKKKHGYTGIVVLLCLIVLTISGTYMLYKGAIKKGLRVATKAYETEKKEVYDSQFPNAYEKYYNKTLEEEQIKNRTVINIKSTNEESKYEVLGIVEQFFQIQSKEVEDQGIRCWEYFTGEAEFVIDMQELEYIIDSDHDYVLIRTKKPVIANIRVLEESAEEERFVFYYENKQYDRRSFKKNLQNMDFAKRILNEIKDMALTKFKDSILNNDEYEKMAIENTESLLSNLIHSLNPNRPDLTVEVEFTD